MNRGCFVCLGALLLGQAAYCRPVPTLAGADSLYAAGRLEAAAKAYRAVLTNSPALLTEIEAIFKLGLTLKGLRQYSDAVTNFQQVIVKTDAPVKSGPQAYSAQSYGLNARWEMVTTQMAAGDYRQALQSLQVVRKHRLPTFCGNASAEREYQIEVYEAACYDSLGEWKAALERYFQAAMGSPLLLDFDPAVPMRILAMYEATGEMPKLLSLLDEFDERELKRTQAFRAYLQNLCPQPRRATNVTQLLFTQTRSSRMIRGIVRTRSLAKAGKRSELILALGAASSFDLASPVRDCEAIEAARLLALTPKESVPDIMRAAERIANAPETLLPYALGRCGTPEAVAWLKWRVLRSSNSTQAENLLAAIALSGSAGQQALNELRRIANGNSVLQQALVSYPDLLRRSPRPTSTPVLPTRSPGGPLPGSMKELGL